MTAGIAGISRRSWLLLVCAGLALLLALVLYSGTSVGLFAFNLGNAGLARWIVPLPPPAAPSADGPAALHTWRALPPHMAAAVLAQLRRGMDVAADVALACAARERLALAALAAGDADAALAVTGDAVCSSPLLAYYRGVAHEAAGQRELALAAWRANPLALAYLTHEAEAFRRAGQPAQQIAGLRLAIEAWPEQPAGYYKLAGLYWAQGETSQAVALLRQGTELDRSDSAEYHFAVGRIAYAAGNWPAAAEALSAALARDPRLVAAHMLLGNALLSMGRLAEAEAAFRAELALRPADVWSLIGLARMAEARGDLAEARRLGQAALAASPGHPEALRFLDGLNR